MSDDVDPFALEALLDGLEYSGAPPHLVEHLRALVRAEGWGWPDGEGQFSYLAARAVATLQRMGYLATPTAGFAPSVGTPWSTGNATPLADMIAMRARFAHTPSGEAEQGWWTPDASPGAAADDHRPQSGLGRMRRR